MASGFELESRVKTRYCDLELFHVSSNMWFLLINDQPLPNCNQPTKFTYWNSERRAATSNNRINADSLRIAYNLATVAAENAKSRRLDWVQELDR